MPLDEMITRKPASKPARVRAEVGYRVFVGDVHLPDVDFRSRVSDLLNDPNRRFLPLADVEITNIHSGQSLGRIPFLLLRMEAIDVVVPLSEGSERPPLT